MRKETLIKKVVASIGSAALAIALGACAHHDATADNGYGQVRTEAPATPDSSAQVVGTAPVPANAQGTTAASTTPPIISGPAAVDSDGRAYTSSSAGGNGNAANLGTNTNVNLIPKKTSSSTVVVSEAPAETPVETAVTTPTPTVVETPAAPVVETPAPAAPVVETPMASSTTETPATTETPKTHRKMHKD